MKKKILGGLLVVAIAAVTAFNMSMNTQEKELSLLALANVEALAGNEGGGVTINCSDYCETSTSKDSCSVTVTKDGVETKKTCNGMTGKKDW